MNMRTIIVLLLALTGLTASAQSASELYAQGKQLYEQKDYAAAFPKLKAAAEKGHKKAQYRLGRCYDKGRGTAEDDQQAARWYGQSAAQGYAKAQYQLGKCYKDGEGVAKDKKRAVALFTQAAQQDLADAQYALGKAYFRGKGVAASQQQARKWLRRAVSNPKGGTRILDDLRSDAAAGEEDAKAMLTLIGKK